MGEIDGRPAAEPAFHRPSVLTFVLVALVFAIGNHILIPGLDLDALAPQIEAGGPGVLARLSILALGVMPLFTVLILLEFIRLIMPKAARWQDGKGADGMRITIAALTLLLAALQGIGIATAIAETGLVRAEAQGLFGIVAIACFLGSTALLV